MVPPIPGVTFGPQLGHGNGAELGFDVLWSSARLPRPDPGISLVIAGIVVTGVACLPCKAPLLVRSDSDRIRALALPAFRHEDDPEAVRVLEGQAMLRPVRIAGRDRIDADPRRDRLHRLIVAEVEDEQ